MRIVLDTLNDENGKEWYEVYIVDEKGSIVTWSDEVFDDLEKAFAHLTKISRRVF